MLTMLSPYLFKVGNVAV